MKVKAVVFILVSILFLNLANVSLAQEAKVSGKVVDSQGSPIANSKVKVTNPDGKIVTVVTDMEGTYTLTVPAGTYSIEVNGAQDSNLPSIKTSGQIISGDTVKDFTIETGSKGATENTVSTGKNNVIIYLLLSALILLGGSGVYLYMKTYKKKIPLS